MLTPAWRLRNIEWPTAPHARGTCRLTFNLQPHLGDAPPQAAQINDLVALFPTCGRMEFRVTQLVSPISVRFRVLPAGVFAVSSPMGCDAPSARRDLGTRACLASFPVRSSAVASAGQQSSLHHVPNRPERCSATGHRRPTPSLVGFSYFGWAHHAQRLPLRATGYVFRPGASLELRLPSKFLGLTPVVADPSRGL